MPSLKGAITVRKTWSLHSGRWQFSGLGYSYKAAGPELDPEDFSAQDQGQEAELSVTGVVGWLLMGVFAFLSPLSYLLPTHSPPSSK